MAMMISKFHKLVGSKKVWTVFAVLISVAFVIAYTGGKSGKQRTRSQQQEEVVGKLFGKKVTRQEFGMAYRNVYLMTVLRTGQPISINEQVDSYLRQNAWQRLAVLKKAHQMKLVITDEQIANAIRQQPLFLNQQTGMFDRKAYDAFFSQIMPRIGLRMTPKEFEIMLGENLLIDKASQMAVQGALVTDEEVDHAFHIYADKLTVQYAAIPRSLAGTPEVTEDDAKEYYYNYPNQFTYPDKVKVRYVEFAVTDFADASEVTDQMVTNYYNTYKDRFIVEGTEASTQPEYQPMGEVQDTIVDEINTALARRKAATAAGVFVSKLSNPAVTFDKAAEEAEKTISTTAPFALGDTVRGVDPTAQFAQAAFGLEQDETHYYSDPVVGKDSVYVLALAGKMPSFLPDFDVVAEDAMVAAKTAAIENAYVQKAESVHADIETALKAGMSFDDAAGKFSLKLETVGPFSAEEPPDDELGQDILKATVLFDAGTLVDLIPTEDDFIVAYIVSKAEADRASADPYLLAQLKTSVGEDKASRLAASWQQSVMEEANLEEISVVDGDNS